MVPQNRLQANVTEAIPRLRFPHPRYYLGLSQIDKIQGVQVLLSIRATVLGELALAACVELQMDAVARQVPAANRSRISSFLTLCPKV